VENSNRDAGGWHGAGWRAGRAAWIAAGLAAIGAAGCVKATGSFTDGAFAHTTYPYRVVPAADGILDVAWRLENFQRKRDGELEQKKSDELVSDYRLDSDADGQPDATLSIPTFDLRYEHRQRDGVIWLRTFPISGTLRIKELRVLMQNYIDQIAGVGYETVDLEKMEVLERRFASEMLDRGDATLAGRRAYVATVDVANIDQVHLSPTSRAVRVRLVLVRPDFAYIPDKNNSAAFPVLMMAAYSNLPEDFERDLPSFERFLGEIEIVGDRGWQLSSLERLAPVAPAADAPAAPPAAAPAAPPQPAPAAPAPAATAPAASPPPAP